METRTSYPPAAQQSPSRTLASLDRAILEGAANKKSMQDIVGATGVAPDLIQLKYDKLTTEAYITQDYRYLTKGFEVLHPG